MQHVKGGKERKRSSVHLPFTFLFFQALSNLYVALYHGCQLEKRCRVVEVKKDLRQNVWKVTAEKRAIKGGKLSKLFLRARKVINCGGNYSDEVDHLVPRTIDEGKPFTIQPGRHNGYFYIKVSQSTYKQKSRLFPN